MSNGEIREAAVLFNIRGTLTDNYLNKVRLSQGEPPKSKLALRKWLREQKIAAIVYQSKAVRTARNILSEAPKRKCLEMLILADCVAEHAEKYTDSIIKQKVPADVYLAYRHYFFNRDLLSLNGWSAYLEEVNPDIRWLYTSCYSQGVEHALWKQGYREEFDEKEAAQAAAHEALMRFFELGNRRNTRDVALSAVHWTDVYSKFRDIANEQGGALADVLARLQGVSIKLETADLKTIKELSNGVNSNNPDAKEE